MTDTLTNEKPLLTEDLPFDLGDVLKCELFPAKCAGDEAVWLVDSAPCDCFKDIPGCERCRQLVLEWLETYGFMAECTRCGVLHPGYKNWRPI